MTEPRAEKLTKRLIDSYRHRGGWDVHWDTEIPGFGVRLYSSGKKSFVLSYRANGRKRLMVLGRYGADLTLPQARDKAIIERAKVREGRDPSEERRQVYETAINDNSTFREVLDEFTEKHARPRQRTWKETRRTLEVNCAPWLNRRISSITKADAYGLLDGFVAAGQEAKARVTLTWLKSMFDWSAKRRDVRSVMEAVELEIHGRIRDRHYADDEVCAVWEAASALGPIEGAFIKLTLLLGVRKGELVGMRRSEFDDPDQPTLWIVPHERTKSRKRQRRPRVYVVPLPKLAQRIIKSLPRLDDDLVFPGMIEGRPLVPGTNLKTRVRKAARVDDWTYHACRDTIATWLENQGASEYERGLVLNHAGTTVTSDYSHGYPTKLKRRLLEKWAQHVAGLLQPEGVAVLS